MAKQIKFGTEAKQALLAGVSTTVRAVASTLGPRGNNVAYARKWGSPSVNHDGVSVAKEIELSDPFENMGAQLVKEAAIRTNDAAGDGTTTASILAESIALEAHKNITAGFNAMSMRRGIEKAVETLVSGLEQMAIPVASPKEIEQVAVISAQNPEIGKIVASAVNKMGKDGVVAVEESHGSEITVEYKQGLDFDRGFESNYFITDQVLQEASLDDPYILITDKAFRTLNDLAPFLNNFYKEGNPIRPLVIISDEISGDALGILVVNKIKTGLPILAIKAPSYGDVRKSILEDIAIFTGGKFISSDSGITLDKVTDEDLGRARRITSGKDSTIIVEGHGEESAIQERLTALEMAFDKSDSDFNREKLKERIAKMSSGIAIINVGANSEAEMRERKERVIDAISATKAAMDEGIVPGGETALIRVAHLLKTLEGTDEELVGIKLVARAIEKPFRQLMTNGGFDSGEMIGLLRGVLPKNNFGIDVMDGQVKDLVKAGIVDPVKVTKSALQNAASVAIMLMTIDTLIVDEPEKDVVQD